MGSFFAKPSEEEMSSARSIVDGALKGNRVVVFSKVRRCMLRAVAHCGCCDHLFASTPMLSFPSRDTPFCALLQTYCPYW